MTTDSEHDAAHDMVALPPRVRLCCLREREDGGDWDAKVSFGDCALEPRELARAGDGIVGRLRDPAAVRWFDAVGVGDTAAWTKNADTALELVSTRKREYRIDPARRQCTQPIGRAFAPDIYHFVRAEAAQQDGGVALSTADGP